MNSIKLSAALLMLSFTAFGQSISMPKIHSMEDVHTIITAVDTDSQYTIVSFKHISPAKGAWVQLNKSMYLQDAGSEDRYQYIRSEGIPLRLERLYTKKDNEIVDFKVYFEKLKPGTKKINVIERARSAAEQTRSNVSFMNYFGVDLTQSRPANSPVLSVSEDVVPPSHRNRDVAVLSTGEHLFIPGGIEPERAFSDQLKVYANPEVLTKVAKVTKNYYDALLKAGFSTDAALKIVTAQQLFSAGPGGK